MADHSLHNLFLIALSALLFVFIYAKSISKLTLFKLIVFLALFGFLSIHVSPIKAFHAIHSSTHSLSDHTCCIPQFLDNPILPNLLSIDRPVQNLADLYFKSVNALITHQLQNKSPPYIS